MASRDPRADIVDNNPFPKPKIRRIHSGGNSSKNTVYTMDDLKNMFTSKTQKKPQLKQVWEFSDIEKQNLLLATAAFTLALGFVSVRGFWGINELGATEWILMLLLSTKSYEGLLPFQLLFQLVPEDPFAKALEH